MNSSCVLINYPLTLALMIFIQDEPAYIAILILLWLNKILISFFGAKVRQHLINPRFISNQTTFKEFADFMNSSVAKFPRSRTVVQDDSESFDESQSESSSMSGVQNYDRAIDGEEYGDEME